MDTLTIEQKFGLKVKELRMLEHISQIMYLMLKEDEEMFL